MSSFDDEAVADIPMTDSDTDGMDFDSDISEFTAFVDEPEDEEYIRIKVPTHDEFMSITIVYDGREDEHIDRDERKVRWLTDENDEPYKFQTKEEARLFLALNVAPEFIRPTDRPLSIKAYALKK